ncbi:MAG: hypothetical protein K9N47_11050 [Prosthecobacter sp.]|uniref:hypothetical protein n=1 Tax=Prosthecobacter sp. TaxID=1965333 RepID=UPI0025E9889A|nr:hypothetical protein [Prosthecobacter sp.]MCF7786650.1 hypothetical protein [Prosthecobacter sp.]
MKLSLLAPLILPLLLTQCTDPYYGPNGPDTYANPYRQDMRDQGSQMNSMAFERGQQDGQADAQQGQSQNYQRNSSRYDRNTEMAYRDAYNQSYGLTMNSRREIAGYPNQGAAQQPQQGTAQQAPPRDPTYNQGYDYGLRDRTGGRVADPSAQVGRYDPRYRSSFERGYYDGYNATSPSSAPTNSGAGGNLWFR